MKIFNKSHILLFAIFAFYSSGYAQLDIGGDFRIRWYRDAYSQVQDNRGTAEYFRMLGRINASFKASDLVRLNVEVMNLNNESLPMPMRGFSGNGPIHFAVSQMYGEVLKTDFYGLDMVRLRAGRQQFSIGEGLVFGESYYYYDKFDGGRLDIAYSPFNLTLFGAIYGQELSSNGYWAQEASDQIYAAKLGANVYDQDMMLYGVLNRPRGDFNDSYILGAGSSGSFLGDKLEYMVDAAYQKFNQPPGGFAKAGIGYMGSLAYSFSYAFFKTIKLESKYAAFQGDDPNTSKIEQFSPPFPDFDFGERTGFVNQVVGGAYPHEDKNMEGTRIWYSRIYFIPKVLPKVRLQFQYTRVNPYTARTDGYNEFDSEFSIKLYYNLTRSIQFQARYERVIPNDVDKDLNKNGVISSLEDRYNLDSFMFEFKFKF
jgi:hypothetical protein